MNKANKTFIDQHKTFNTLCLQDFSNGFLDIIGKYIAVKTIRKVNNTNALANTFTSPQPLQPIISTVLYC